MRAKRRKFVLCFVAAIAVACGPVVAEDDGSFREFPDEEVLQPAELMRTLIGLQMQLPPGFAERLTPPSLPRPGGNIDPQLPPATPDFPTPRIERPNIENPPTEPGGRNPPKIVTPPDLYAPRLNPTPEIRVEPPEIDPDAINRIPRISQPLALPGGSPQIETGRNSGERPAVPMPVLQPQPPGSTPTPPAPSIPNVEPPAPPPRVAPRDEGFRNRFNRILLDAAEKSLGEQGDGGSSGESTLESLFSRAVKSAQRSMGEDGSNWQRGLRAAWNDVRHRVNRSDNSFAAIRNGGSASGSNIGESDGYGTIMWVALVLSLIGLSVYLWRRKLSAVISSRTSRLAVRARLALKSIRSRRDLVLAVDHVVQWNLGPQTDWWNSRAVRKSLTAAFPQLSAQIRELVANYEVARYAPESHEVSATTLRRCNEILRQLVVTGAGLGETQSNKNDDDAIR